MAVKEANSNYKSFTFNGISAADYGVYVTDVNVFNSAERAVEYITIPGRNGSFALDHGRFENITVEYECALGQDTDVDFATAISDFRNALAVAKGYQRLEDDMNPDEYRMAVFSKGLEAPTLNQQTATFKVEFNCKPQRYLKSGETAISVTSGQTITNPTLFDASPTLYVDGYGTINIGDNTVTINNAPYGYLLLANAKSTSGVQTLDAGNYALLNSGDSITVSAGCGLRLSVRDGSAAERRVVSATVTFSGDMTGTAVVTQNGLTTYFDISFGALAFAKGTGAAKTGRVDIGWTDSDGGTQAGILNYTYTYDSANETMTLANTYESSFGAWTLVQPKGIFNYADVYGVSTKTPADDTVVIDTEIGEAYTDNNGVISSANAIVSMPAKLPTLATGDNTIDYANTVTGLEIVPRWWKV